MTSGKGPFRIAVYGKGGIGKSTISANISYELASRGYRVLQVGCRPDLRPFFFISTQPVYKRLPCRRGSLWIKRTM